MMWYDVCVTTVSEANNKFVTTVTESNNDFLSNSNYKTTFSY